MENELIVNPEAKNILFVLAHPDDDVFVSGSIKKLVDIGHNVRVMYYTSGALGSDVNGVITDPTELGEAREAEAIAALGILGVLESNIYFLRLDNKSTDEPLILTTISAKLVSENFTPNVLFSFTHTGLYGHFEHKIIGRVTNQLYRSTDLIESIHYFDLPFSDAIGGVPEGEGGDLTWNYKAEKSGGVPDSTISVVCALTASELQARLDHIEAYVSQFTELQLSWFQGHIKYRPYEYLIAGPAHSGDVIPPFERLANLFNLQN